MDSVLKDLVVLAEGSDGSSMQTYINDFLESVTKEEITIPREEVVQVVFLFSREEVAIRPCAVAAIRIEWNDT